MPTIRTGAAIILLFNLAALGAPILCASDGHHFLESAFALCCDEGSGTDGRQASVHRVASSQDGSCSACTDVPLMAAAAPSGGSREVACPETPVAGPKSRLGSKRAGRSLAFREPAPLPGAGRPSQLRC